MKLLFLHQAFPAQFRSLAPALAARGDEVRALTTRDEAPPDQAGVTIMRYRPKAPPTPGVHRWVVGLECGMILASAVYQVCQRLKADGYEPDVIVAHPNWGESLFVKSVWPAAKLGLYCEIYHAASGLAVGFDPEFPAQSGDMSVQVRLDNATTDLNFGFADAGMSPTQWQADSFPAHWRGLIDVAHEGVDTGQLSPKPDIQIDLGDGVVLTRADEVLTFANRNLEPLRGWHIFARALPRILAERPQARIIVIGGDQPGYGDQPTDAANWKQKLIDEIRPTISDEDWRRVHFTGRLPYDHYVALLQLSSVHVYLTYPSILSWSLIEAMSLGCAIVGSDTAPVREAITHGETGRLVDFFDVAGLAAEVCRLLDDPAERARLGAAARAHAVTHYDLKTVCLPRQIAWIDKLAAL